MALAYTRGRMGAGGAAVMEHGMSSVPGLSSSTPFRVQSAIVLSRLRRFYERKNSGVGDRQTVENISLPYHPLSKSRL